MSNKKNKPLMPKLRFPAFRNSPEWISEKVDRLVDTITPPKKLPTSSYAVNGDFPIIDQSQNAICGWTDDREALIKDDLPLIIFGDHTCILKLLDRPFAQGADGIKILKPRPRIGTSYLYQYLSYRPVVTEEYKRHYSILKEKVVLFPDFKTGEQQKIADCLSSLDELIVAQARKVNALKTHKKGLMQQLFPREGETQPRLRFPEFRDAEEWTQKALGDIADVLMCKRIFANETNPTEGVPFYKIGTLGGTPDAFISQDIFSDYKQRYNYPRLGEVLITCSGTIGKCLPFNGSDSYFQDSNIVWIDNSTLIVTNQFLLSILSSVDWSGLNSTTITRIYGPDLRGLVIKFPQDHLEQQRIANCLTALDDVITSAIQELATLKTHKKGLMQQLFPSAAELAA